MKKSATFLNTARKLSLFFSSALTLGAAIAQAQVPPAESTALQAFYNATDGDHWIDNSNWKISGAFNVGQECTWVGITCIGGTHVVSINLTSNNLVGTMTDLTPLTSLQLLALSANHISGSIPALTGLTNLSGFFVAGNQLSGPIPDLSGLINLLTFSAANNQLSGSIPDLSVLTNLTYFDVGDNRLSGPIPSSTTTHLEVFRVGNNKLTGLLPIPSGTLHTSQQILCPNYFPHLGDTNWDVLTGETPWYTNCDGLFYDGLDY